MRAYLVDILAVGFFVLEWTVYALTLEHTAYGRDSLSARMHIYREVWIRRMLDREARMVDMQIMASLQNGTAFFASTSLIAVGGALALLRSTSEALGVLQALPIDISPPPALWEIKCVGLVLIFIYAFFKFAWAYRLFNYVAILIGFDAASIATRHAAGGSACHSNHAAVRDGGPAFQSRTARVLFRARLSRLVRQSLGLVRDDGGGRDRHLAPAICLERLAGDGKLMPEPGDQDLASAENTASGAWAITASNARAGPRGMRLPCSQLRMVSTGTPSRLANSICVRQARRRRSRTAGGVRRVGRNRGIGDDGWRHAGHDRRQRKLLPVPQFDDPPVCFQSKALHSRLILRGLRAAKLEGRRPR